MALWDTETVGHQPEVPLHRHRMVQRVIHHPIPYSVLDTQGIAGHVQAVDQYPPGVGLGIAGHDPHQRRLAGAVGPQQPGNLPGLHVERHILEGYRRPVSLTYV